MIQSKVSLLLPGTHLKTQNSKRNSYSVMSEFMVGGRLLDEQKPRL